MNKKIEEILKINGFESFEEFIDKYERFVYKICYKFLNNSQDAEDITQEVFLVIFKKIKNLRKPDSLTNWIYTITLNLVRENLRKKYREKYLLDKLKKIKAQNLNIENAFENNEIKRKIKLALEKLSPMQRKVIELKFFDGLKIKEISEITNCKEGTVKVHIFRGVHFLKEKLKNEL
ncbi:MAG: sigma-70 family RNA polymerase sigma factor [bacterium]|nr:sigma-70 family RNA polymerase sigma factor [bacterium]MDW8163556.1 sigma-70 family RNA polymerase sigma factor [Candidatus Omnitrophota bacterium]